MLKEEPALVGFGEFYKRSRIEFAMFFDLDCASPTPRALHLTT